ncbi:hypothetical protein BgiBS90_012490 [Biomphalaria glabrata]|nr:hypothetical protein BgiBS90_012490 [Biomphalaria glabrata]
MVAACQASEKCFSDTALCLIIIGVIMALTGLLWPASPTYKLDARLSAEENERLEANHARLMTTIYSIMVAGMGFVLLGAIITSTLLMKTIISERLCLAKKKRLKKTSSLEQSPPQPPPQQPPQQQQTSPDIPMNSRSVSWSQHELTSIPKFSPYFGTRTESDERLLDSDQLEMNRYFSNKKPYGGVN